MTSAERQLSELERFGSVLGLDRERELLRRLGNPQDSLRVIHVAGTNGKGSVCRYIYEVLIANGHSAGLFTSPFLRNFQDHLVFGYACGDAGSEPESITGITASCASDVATVEHPEFSAESGEMRENAVNSAVSKSDESEAYTSAKLDVNSKTNVGDALGEDDALDVGDKLGLGDRNNIIGDLNDDVDDEGEEDFRKTCSVHISESEMDSCTERVMSVAKAMEADGFALPTKFEALTAIAFLWFAEKKPDFVVLEVGLGGRQDSTNVIDHPLVSVITSISKDHTAQLGDSIDEISAEKAGIIKEGCPVVCGAGNEGKRGIAKRAYECRAPLLDIDRIYKRVYEKAASGSRFSAVIRGVRYEDIYLSMGGEHQIANAMCALATIEVLRKTHKVPFSMEDVRHGMAQARVEGRFEIVSKKPLVIFDGAHNAAGAAALAGAAEELLSGKRILLLTGIQSDKDTGAILREFLRFADGIILTESSNPSALSAAQFQEKAEQVMRATNKAVPIESIKDRASAFDIAKQKLSDYDCLIVAGSLYLLSDYIRAAV